MLTAGASPFDGSSERISSVSPGWYVRSENYDAVYYVSSDMQRYPIWNPETFFTWQDSFAAVVWLTDATLPTLPLGEPLLPKAGTVLVKLADGPSVYALEDNSTPTLREIPDERTAETAHGPDWSDYVIDIPPTLFGRFIQGVPFGTDEWPNASMLKKRLDLVGTGT